MYSKGCVIDLKSNKIPKIVREKGNRVKNRKKNKMERLQNKNRIYKGLTQCCEKRRRRGAEAFS